MHKTEIRRVSLMTSFSRELVLTQRQENEPEANKVAVIFVCGRRQERPF